MKWTRKFVCTLVLTLGVLSLAASRGSAQEAKGTFTLTRDVHWQGALVPAGEYHFSIEGMGLSEMLTLRKLSGSRAGFMMLIHDSQVVPTTGVAQLVLESLEGGTFVSRMDLPPFGMTLRFTVPREGANSQIGQANSFSAAAGAK